MYAYHEDCCHDLWECLDLESLTKVLIQLIEVKNRHFIFAVELCFYDIPLTGVLQTLKQNLLKFLTGMVTVIYNI